MNLVTSEACTGNECPSLCTLAESMSQAHVEKAPMQKKRLSRGNLTLISSLPPAPAPATLTTIDLFSGAGGITEGFREAGYRCLYANDLMPEAMETFAANHKGAKTDCRKIELVDPARIRRELKLKKGALDVLVGGPPCQGFSINAPSRFLEDPRNSLFKDYVRFLEEFKPKAFLFENVPGLLSIGDGKVLDLILDEFVRLDYHVTVKILFAAHYGVPQERWRLILTGSRFGEIAPPEPTHYAKGRPNFRTDGLTFQQTDSDAERLKPAVTVGEAIGDLPRLAMGEGAETIGYTTVFPQSAYAHEMRSGNGITFNHYAAKLSKQNAERMLHVEPGGSWRDIPHHLLPKGMQRARRSDHTKRYGRLRMDGLPGTVLTKCDPHWGTVFLPDQNRALTVREAARFQSFPDTYEFKGSRVSQYEQVGNAVPVLMAKAIAGSIRAHLEAHGCVQTELLEAVNG
jgi:DNA (cytosine-5)-methyltransferase 1